MVKASCNNVLWEVYIGVSGQGGAPIGPPPLLKINESPTAKGWSDFGKTAENTGKYLKCIKL